MTLPVPDPLVGLDEAAFRTRVLIPLLTAMGYRDVDHTHGADELGKDIVAWEEALDGSREYVAVVAKAGRVGASASGDAGTVATQIRQAFGASFRSKTSTETHHVHTVFVATTGTVKQASKNAILSQIDALQQRHVRFWDGDTVRVLLAKHFPEPTVPDYTSALHGALAALEHFDVSTRITATEIEHEVYARHDDTTLADITFRFPDTPEAESALEAMNRYIEDGEPVVIPGDFIQSFVQHEELTRVFGDAHPTEIHVGAPTGGQSSQIAVEIAAEPVPLRYEGLTMRCVRSGIRRSKFETDSDRPLTVALVTEKMDDGKTTLQAHFNLFLGGHSPAEAERAIAVWTALRSGAAYRVLALPQNRVLSEGSAASLDLAPFPLDRYVSDLTVIARRLGWDLRVPDEVMPQDVRAASTLRSVLDSGAYSAPFSSYTITYTPDPDEPDTFFGSLVSGTPFWFRKAIEPEAYRLLGRTLDLGAGESLIPLQLAASEADRVRALLQDGAPSVQIRFDSVEDQPFMCVYPGFMAESARLRYEALSDAPPPALVEYVHALASETASPSQLDLSSTTSIFP